MQLFGKFQQWRKGDMYKLCSLSGTLTDGPSIFSDMLEES